MMKPKDEVEQKETKLNETNLTDLPTADEEADSTKGGKGSNGNLQISQFYYGATQPGV